jgi:pyruvate dehydrogenase E2 component (dihydrolipoamide acetyltransferase)
VETEKIVNQVESPGAGVLRRILADAGDTKPVGALIGVLADADVTEREIDNFVASFRGATVTFEPESPADAAANAAPQPPVASSGGGDTEQRISPVARRIAERMGVDVSNVPGTGRNGRVSKEDVEAYIAARSAATAAPDFQRVRLSATRKTIARRLTEAAQSIPHIRLDIDVAADALLARRAALTSQGVGASVNDMLLRVCALALLEHPQINAQLDGDDLLQFKHADIAMAVATPAGLVTPIIRQADRKSIEAIAAESRTLVERASAGTLARDDISGGSFTISNLGMHGIQRFDAIINPPQVAILAVGRIEERAVVRQGVIGAARMLTLTLAADHRVVDGAVGARFLDTMRRLIESSSAL